MPPHIVRRRRTRDQRGGQRAQQKHQQRRLALDAAVEAPVQPRTPLSQVCHRKPEHAAGSAARSRAGRARTHEGVLLHLLLCQLDEAGGVRQGGPRCAGGHGAWHGGRRGQQPAGAAGGGPGHVRGQCGLPGARGAGGREQHAGPAVGHPAGVQELQVLSGPLRVAPAGARGPRQLLPAAQGQEVGNQPCGGREWPVHQQPLALQYSGGPDGPRA
mmetsp:Transcript_28973/g.75117  ORF Transcript_28973/g.75117 Transcript_28973/m.75117 type:complete len:215 (-) Transcript_28973:2352-2996(-)